MTTLEPVRPPGDRHLHIDIALAWVAVWATVGLLIGLAYVALTTPAAILSAWAGDTFAGLQGALGQVFR